MVMDSELKALADPRMAALRRAIMKHVAEEKEKEAKSLDVPEEPDVEEPGEAKDNTAPISFFTAVKSGRLSLSS